jgi:hypothetical protein
MGRKARAKRWRRFVKAAEAHEVATAKAPCQTCAFNDPECWVADKAIGLKLLKCLEAGTYFWCHHGMRLGGEERLEYQPPLRPDGRVDTSQMEPCGGFVRWAVRLRAMTPEARQGEVLRLQRRMLTRFLAEDPTFGARMREQGIDGAMLQAGITLMLEETWKEAGT